jgi:hypothetical protein
MLAASLHQAAQSAMLACCPGAEGTPLDFRETVTALVAGEFGVLDWWSTVPLQREGRRSLISTRAASQLPRSCCGRSTFSPARMDPGAATIE